MTYIRRTIAEDWEFYRNLVIPKDASAIQVKESRRCFFAGSQQSLQHMIEIAELPQDEGAAELERLLEECLAFAKAIAGGVA